MALHFSAGLGEQINGTREGLLTPAAVLQHPSKGHLGPPFPSPVGQAPWSTVQRGVAPEERAEKAGAGTRGGSSEVSRCHQPWTGPLGSMSCLTESTPGTVKGNWPQGKHFHSDSADTQHLSCLYLGRRWQGVGSG